MGSGSTAQAPESGLKREFSSDKYYTLTRDSFKANYSPVIPQDLNLDVLATKVDETEKTDRQKIKEKIRESEIRFELPYKELTELISCESGFDQERVGAVGEIGLAQYLPATWRRFNNTYGDTQFSIYSAENQVELTARVFHNSGDCSWHCHKCEWTCFRIQHPSLCGKWK